MTDDEKMKMKMWALGRTTDRIDDDPEYVSEIWADFFQHQAELQAERDAYGY